MIDLPMRFPKEWDDRQIEFHLNEGSWCFDNLIDLLEDYSNKHGCICNICKAQSYDLSKSDRAVDGEQPSRELLRTGCI